VRDRNAEAPVRAGDVDFGAAIEAPAEVQTETHPPPGCACVTGCVLAAKYQSSFAPDDSLGDGSFDPCRAFQFGRREHRPFLADERIKAANPPISA
jgi:hypothetical protein